MKNFQRRMPLDGVLPAQFKALRNPVAFTCSVRFSGDGMQNDPSIHPAYADSFRCIGSACEDTCCQGWTVPVDRSTWEKYQAVPQGPLRILMDASVVRSPQAEDGGDAKDAVFAKILMNGANQCPMLSEERLCRIQSDLGEELLSHTCATYPRIVHKLGAWQEKALTFSCPEAARLVLLDPVLLEHAGALQPEPAIELRQSSGPEIDGLPPDFWHIRAIVLTLVRMRVYPLWQRMFVLNLLCQRLDAIDRGEGERSAAAFLGEFEASVANGALRQAMDALPADRGAQLDIVLRLAGMMLHKSNVRPRFVECVRAFTAGIGNGPGATFDSLSAHYARSHDRFYAPFFDRNPHIMENFLINTIVRCQFPFGKEGMVAGGQPDKSREFALLAAQFVLMRGLLIGVAGHYGTAFSEEHVVHTVQAASKHFEHHPEFLNMAHALLKEKQMDGPRGFAILLRDAEMDRGAAEARHATQQTPVRVQPDGRSAG